MRALTLLRQLGRRRDGGVMVEAAMVWPMLFMVLFGLVEYGRFAWTQVALNYAVQQAVRCAQVTPGTCSSNSAIAAYAKDQAMPADVPVAAFTVSSQACGIQVTAAYDYPVTVGALVFRSAPVVRAKACRAVDP
jgi:Flp pilus assembly protein TadG